jgi:hypothetical protein
MTNDLQANIYRERNRAQNASGVAKCGDETNGLQTLRHETSARIPPDGKYRKRLSDMGIFRESYVTGSGSEQEFEGVQFPDRVILCQL